MSISALGSLAFMTNPFKLSKGLLERTVITGQQAQRARPTPLLIAHIWVRKQSVTTAWNGVLLRGGKGSPAKDPSVVKEPRPLPIDFTMMNLSFVSRKKTAQKMPASEPHSGIQRP
jgi:hypothetical protein